MYMQSLKDALENVGYDCLAFATRRTARAVTNYFNVLLRPVDLNVAQFGLMTAIAKMPGRTLREIGEDLILDESTVTRNLTVLERRNLVKSEGGRGRSGKRMSLTTDGEALMMAASAEWKRGNAAMKANITPEVLAGGIAFLNALTTASGALKAGEIHSLQLEPSDIE
jgi:DNA-binding MarR family transcriptional regulator